MNSSFCSAGSSHKRSHGVSPTSQAASVLFGLFSSASNFAKAACPNKWGLHKGCLQSLLPCNHQTAVRSLLFAPSQTCFERGVQILTMTTSDILGWLSICSQHHCHAG